jgi:acid-sensing ion channel, other
MYDLLQFGIFHPFNDQTIIDVEARSGLHFMIHPPDELPSDSSFHFRQYLSYTDIAILPHQVLLSDKLKAVTPQRRNCFLEHEKKLEIFKIYSKQNCEHECQSFVFARRCGCVPFYNLSKRRVL